jgi:uncharacterized protein
MYPQAHLVGLGTSMGAGLILKYAANTGDKCLLKGIVAAAAPFDYKICRKHLGSFLPYFGLSDSFILGQLKRQFNSIQENLTTMEKELQEKGININEVIQSKSSQEFDEKFTIRVCGYENTAEYYEKASVSKDLGKIQVPVLALSSKDDPVVVSKCIPYQEFRKNPKLLLATTNIGGHIGWFTGTDARRWYPKPSIEFLDAVLELAS